MNGAHANGAHLNAARIEDGSRSPRFWRSLRVRLFVSMVLVALVGIGTAQWLANRNVQTNVRDLVAEPTLVELAASQELGALARTADPSIWGVQPVAFAIVSSTDPGVILNRGDGRVVELPGTDDGVFVAIGSSVGDAEFGASAVGGEFGGSRLASAPAITTFETSVVVPGGVRGTSPPAPIDAARDHFQPTVDDLGRRYARRIVVERSDGVIVADSSRADLGRRADEVLAPQRQSSIGILGGGTGVFIIDPGPPVARSTVVRSGSVVAAFPGVDIAPTLQPFSSGSGAASPGSLVDSGFIVAQPIGEPFLDRTRHALLVGGIVAVAAAALAALLLGRTTARPVTAVSRAARRLGDGDLSSRVPTTRGGGELGDLARTFNAMADDLERQERLRRTMISDLAHELRTPLANVQGWLEGLRDGVVEPAPATLASLHDEAVHLGELVTELQDLARLDAGDVRLESAPTDIGELCRQSVSAMQARADAAGVALVHEASGGVDAVVDARRLAQVVRNLLDNALMHTPEGGCIEVIVMETITATTDSGGAVDDFDARSVVIMVRDTGHGIAPSEQPFVFERLYRADGSRARATGGTGLGLAIVKKLVEAHGGTVALESELGRGTTITVCVPIESPEHRIFIDS